MQTLSASEARANFSRLMDEVAGSHDPILIAGERNSAVLLSVDAWSAIQETLHLLAIPRMHESIKGAMAEPLVGSTRQLDW